MHRSASFAQVLRLSAAAALALWAASGATDARAELQTSAQQRCMTKVTGAGLKVAKAQGKEIRACLKAASRSELSLDDGLGCVTADPRNRVALRRAKTATTVARSCSTPPAFGFTSAEVVNASAVDEEIGLVIELFGPSLALGALPSVLDADGATCQATVQSFSDRLLAAKLKVFALCQRNGLKRADIASPGDLSDCISALDGSADPRIVKAVDKLSTGLGTRCAATAVREAFPGRCKASLTLATLRQCVLDAVDCRACTMLAAMHGLPLDCDAHDDGASNGSCAAGTSVTTTTLPPGGGACTNAADEAVLASVDIQTVTATCTFDCLSAPSLPECVAACLGAETGLGAECSLCYGDSSLCGIQNCAGECLASQTAPACTQCLEAAGCIDAFDECAGTGIVTTTTVIPPSTTAPASTTTTTLGPGGACANPADEAVDAAHDLQAEATACTLGCLSAPSLPVCVASCLSAETGLSSECALCWGQSSQCGILACAGECALDQTSPACVACLEASCMPAFEACAYEGGTTTTLATTTTTSGPTTTTTPPPTTTLPPTPGECTNPADEAVLGSVDIQAETTACTLGCLSAPDIAQCVADCVAAATGLSPGCALCYGESSECGITFCAAECAISQTAPACVSCLDASCIPAFDECAGTSGATTTTLAPTTTTTLLPPTTTTTTLPPAGSCDNPADEAVDAAFDLQAEATACTVSCLSAGNRVACITACLGGATGLSAACSGCYAQSAECGLLSCAAECAVDQASVPCQTCLAANCLPAFDACAGTGEPPPPASCENGVTDGGETDVDCGGPCAPCGIGDACAGAGDCASGECVAGTCSAPTTPVALGSCVDGYIDPLTDPDGIDLSGAASGSDDGYRLELAAPADVFVEVTNQSGATSTLRAALVATPGEGASVASGLVTGLVEAGQNGTAGPAALGAGAYYLYVDSALAGTYGGYRVCVVPPPSVAIGTCVAHNVGDGDGDDVQIAGATGVGGDKGIRFTAPVGTSNVILRVRNLSGGADVAAAIYDGATKLPGSETADAMLFTERNAGPFPVSANQPYTVQVDTAEAGGFSTVEVCVFAAGCGDGLLGAGEQCDDNNVVAGDGCSSTCTLESGKIVVGSCRTDSIPLFGSDCDDWTLPIASNRSVFLELANPAGDTLLARGSLRLGSTQLASTGDVPIGQTGSTAVVDVTPNSYTARVCDVTGAGTGTYTVCIRPARHIELGTCFSSNVTDGDGNVIDLAGPISGGDEDVVFQPPRTTTVRLTLSNESVGGLLAAGIYDGQPGNLLPGSAVGQSPSPLAVGQTGQSGLVAVAAGQIYRVYTDIASLGTAGTDYTICLAEVEGDACLNPEDETVRASHNLSAEAEAAGLSCTGSASCISQTLQSDTGLSTACADCYGGVGACAASSCALECLGSSSSSGCRSCVASSCAEEFEVCSGWVYGQ